MTIADFLFPCGLLIGAVLLGFCLSLYFVRYWYFAPLLHRIERIEHRIKPLQQTRPTTEYRQRPSRYMTVERKPLEDY